MVNKYLAWKFRGLLEAGKVDNNEAYFREILRCLDATNGFMSTLYKSGLFLFRLRLVKVVRLGKAMLSSYSSCARMAYGRSLARYKYNPKFHMLCHIVLKLQQDLEASKCPLNPLSYSCQMAEDFINRIATLTRVVNSKVLEQRTFDLYKLAVSQALRES